MRAVIIQHQMDIQIGRNGDVDFLQKVEELHRTMASIALAKDVAGRDIESRKQAGDAMSLVVVRAPLLLSGPHGQHRLGTAERLNLRLLIHAQHQRMMGWIEIEPNNIPHFVDQQWISR